MTMEKVTDLRQISPQDFAMLGITDVAYVKSKPVKGVVAFAIHSADGTEVAVLPTYDAAIATILQNDLDPVGLH